MPIRFRHAVKADRFHDVDGLTEADLKDRIAEVRNKYRVTRRGSTAAGR